MSSDTRGAVIALVGGVLGALIGGGTSFATGLIANDSNQTQFAFTQERAAYVQVAGAADVYREAAVTLPLATDEPSYQAAQAATAAAFVRFSQAYNEAFLVLEDTGELVELFNAAAAVEAFNVVRFSGFGAPAQDNAVEDLDLALIDFLEDARGQVRERLSSVD